MQLGFLHNCFLHLWIQADTTETLALPKPRNFAQGSNLSNVHCCIPWGHKTGFIFPSRRKPMVSHHLTRQRVCLGGGGKSHHKLMLVWRQAAQTSAPVKWHLWTASHHHCKYWTSQTLGVCNSRAPSVNSHCPASPRFVTCTVCHGRSTIK